MENKDKDPEDKKFTDELLRQGMLGGDDHALALAEKFGMQIFLELPELELTRDYYKKVPYAFSKKKLCSAYQR